MPAYYVLNVAISLASLRNEMRRCKEVVHIQSRRAILPNYGSGYVVEILNKGYVDISFSNPMFFNPLVKGCIFALPDFNISKAMGVVPGSLKAGHGGSYFYPHSPDVDKLFNNRDVTVQLETARGNKFQCPVVPNP